MGGFGQLPPDQSAPAESEHLLGVGDLLGVTDHHDAPAMRVVRILVVQAVDLEGDAGPVQRRMQLGSFEGGKGDRPGVRIGDVTYGVHSFCSRTSETPGMAVTAATSAGEATTART